MRRKLVRICAALGALALGVGALAESVDLLEVDHRLYELGYRDGACSGELNDVMVNALRNFQQANGLGITGAPDAGTVLVLNSDQAVSQMDYLLRVSDTDGEAEELTIGAYGDGVLRLQRTLMGLGYFDGQPDGTYGYTTTTAVSRFQLANGLEQTGIADGAVMLRLYQGKPISWDEFLEGSTAAAGDSGAKVRTLQYWLDSKGYFEGECTGRYGESTQRAVRQFQSDSGLEVSGDADLETCRALFTDVDDLLADASALRRGATGAEVDELCRSLSALGYDAGDEFDMRAELALMQFQRANGLSVTGAADAITILRLGEPDAVGIEGYAGAGAEAMLEESFSAQIVRQAFRVLGQMSGFEDDFELVQYVYLKCGVSVVNRSQFAPMGVTLDEVTAGDMMVVRTGSGEICGVASSDGGIIYRAADGRILMSYPSFMDAEDVQLYRLVLE